MLLCYGGFYTGIVISEIAQINNSINARFVLGTCHFHADFILKIMYLNKMEEKIAVLCKNCR